MRHYVAYNKDEEWGAYDVDPNETQFGHWTRRPKKQLEKMIGEAIWVFSGSRAGNKMEYRLCSWYRAEEIDESDEEMVSAGFRAVIGTGAAFYPPMIVNGFDWFAELYAEQNRFSYGLNQIRSERVIQALEAIRKSYLLSLSKASVEDDLETCENTYADLPETTRLAVIQSRLGQGQFRHGLVAYWGECAVTGCRLIETLRASHIKPWRDATNEERLDVFNGLLLAPNLDACFDLGFISFDDHGYIVLSPVLDMDMRKTLHLEEGMKLSRLDERHKVYLVYHWDHVFRQG